MKNIIIIILFTFSLTGISQTSVVPLEDGYELNPPAGIYYKDLGNVFNNFEGTWLYDDGIRSLKIVLQKEEAFFNRGYYLDFISGEFEYKENGVAVINTLPDLDNASIAPNRRAVSGRNIYDRCYLAPVSDCIDGEKRIEIGIRDILENKIYYNLILHKSIINGQEALRVSFDNASTQTDFFEGEEVPEATIPMQGELVFYKQ